MATAEDRKRCCLQWDIYNPFLPRAKLEATFYYQYPWEVIFEPMNRGINYWEFAITLAHKIIWFKTTPNVVARNVEVTILYGPDSVKRKILGDIQFSDDNRNWYRLQETVVMGDVRLMHKLSIKVEFELAPGEIRVDNHHYNDGDLLQLSNDMRTVQNVGENKDLILRSGDSNRSFNIHSYIIKFRWINFFNEHPPRIGEEIQTNISEYLLSSIITYMYCGDFPFMLPFMTYPQYGTELCRVIDRHKLEHLYKVLVKNDLKQHRVTINNMYMDSHLFPLSIVENRTVNRLSHTWVVNPNFGGQYEIVFRMQVGNELGNWLSYSLESRCQSEVYVEVRLEVVRKEEGAPEATFPFHGRDQPMEPSQAVESGPVLFLGCPETFGNSNVTNIKYSIRCFLNVSRGRRLQLLKSVDSIEYRDATERYNVLSDHMRYLYENKMNAKMIVSRSSDLITKPRKVEIVHKEIFKARVPGWSEIVIATGNSHPDRAICDLRLTAMKVVLQYIYTGKVTNIPKSCLDEIQTFARQTGFECLLNLVIRFMAGKREKRY